MAVPHYRRSGYLAATGPALIVLAWAVCGAVGVFPESFLPRPLSVVRAIAAEVENGRLLRDIIASLFRVSVGFGLAAGLGIPIGMGIGHSPRAREALLPLVNFFRNLSPLAWIPFAILWFGIGDVPSIFLIFMAAFFPMVLATSAAVANIPVVYFRVSDELGLSRARTLRSVTLPAIAPQVITALRVGVGLSWLVVVAAEMIAGTDGLGFAVWDARNGLRADLLVAVMLTIGLLGVGIDHVLLRLTMLPSVKWAIRDDAACD